MGLNAQTSVPKYAAAEVLTAANMNISAGTGVPVFASGTTRNAGFGGAGEKTLAEGQFAYLEDSNLLQVYNGTVWVNLLPDGGTVLTSQTTTSGTLGDLATVGPSVTIDTGTSALVSVSCFANNTLGAGNTAFMSVAVSGASTIAASTNWGARTTFWSANASVTMAGFFIMTGLTAGSNTFTAKYSTDGSTISFGNRFMVVIPLTL
jgi:hypothetical protein